MRHLVLLKRHIGAHVFLFLGALADHLKEVRNLDVRLLLGRLYAQQARLAVDVVERFHNEVVELVNEALACLLEDLAARATRRLEKFDVLACTDLSLLFDALTILEGAHLVRVAEHVVAADLANEVLTLALSRQEHLFNLEVLNAHPSRSLNLKVA